jgi:hypothetical protein
LIERGTAVEVNSAASLAARGCWDRDVDWTVDWAQELPEDRGGGVAENGAGAAGEDGGHEVGVEVRGAVAYGVDALVDSV